MLSLSVGHQSDVVESRNRKRSDFKRVVAKLLVDTKIGATAKDLFWKSTR